MKRRPLRFFLRPDLAVTFEESILGADKPLKYQAKLFCEKCNGRGAEYSKCWLATGEYTMGLS